MIDIHSHFLPGIDDGAKDMEMTAEMLRLAHGAGTTAIVGTPHSDNHYRFVPERVRELLEQARKIAPPGLELYSGCDFHLTFDNVQKALRDRRPFTINQGRYLLIELSDMVIFPNTGDLYAELESAGCVIILTHPERNPLLRQRLELIEDWVAQGRLMQVTGSSLLGQWGPKAQAFSKTLLDKGLVHFIASDGHDPEFRPPRMDEAWAWVTERYGAALAQLLFVDHGKAVIENRPIDLSSFPPAAPQRPSWSQRLGKLFGK